MQFLSKFHFILNVTKNYFFELLLLLIALIIIIIIIMIIRREVKFQKRQTNFRIYVDFNFIGY